MCSGANTTFCPGSSRVGVESSPIRMRGPCRSSNTAAASRLPWSTVRSSWIHRARVSDVPCDALIRTTSTPASRREIIFGGVSQAGPSVATILVRRREVRGMAGV